jgi:UDPglucose 6-dehydrogenase
MAKKNVQKLPRKTPQPVGKHKLSVIGLGKLGSAYAAFFAQKGYIVTGYDTDAAKVDSVRAGKAPVVETDLQQAIDEAGTNLTATHSIAEAVLASDISFMIVPTPSTKDGSFSTEYVERAATEMGKALKNKKTYHLFVLTSTVLPLNSRERIIPALEKSSGKKCGKDFGYCYSPSLIAIGSILKNLREPDFLFLGGFDERSTATLDSIFKDVYPDKSAERTTIESAELAKISLNAYVTMKITFANVLGEMCQNIPNSNVDEVTRAIGKDKRIGSAVLRSGLGYGGPCFPRDNFAFSYTANRFGVDSAIALSVHHTNEGFPQRIAKRILSLLTDIHKSIGFLSLAYKTDTTMVDESHAFKIAQTLLEQSKKRIIVHEPLGNYEAMRYLGDKAHYVESIQDLIEHSDVIFVSQFDKKNADLAQHTHKYHKPLIIIDPWGALKPDDFPNHVHYVPIGRIQHESAQKKISKKLVQSKTRKLGNKKRTLTKKK